MSMCNAMWHHLPPLLCMQGREREEFISSLLSFSLSFGRTKEAREGRRRGADFAVDVAPQSRSNLRLLPLHREEAGRAWIFAVLDVAPVLVAVEVGVP